MRERYKHFAFTFLALTSLVACGNEDFFVSQNSSLYHIAVRDSSIEPNSTTSISIGFIPGGELVSHDSDGEPYYDSVPFGITVFIPEETKLKKGTSRVTDEVFSDILFGNPDKKDPFDEGHCPNGTHFIRYFFEKGELTDPSVNPLVDRYLELDIEVSAEANNKQVGSTISTDKDACSDLPTEKLTLNVSQK